MFFFICRWWRKNKWLNSYISGKPFDMCFCKKIYFRYCNLFIRKDLLERYLLEKIKSLVGHLQFMVGQTHNLVWNLILPRVFPVRQNAWWVFRLVGQILILVGHCPMSDRYFKACPKEIYDSSKKTTLATTTKSSI